MKESIKLIAKGCFYRQLDCDYFGKAKVGVGRGWVVVSTRHVCRFAKLRITSNCAELTSNYVGKINKQSKTQFGVCCQREEKALTL